MQNAISDIGYYEGGFFSDVADPLCLQWLTAPQLIKNYLRSRYFMYEIS